MALVGNSAYGKTELAKDYARTSRHKYHHIWFVQVETWESDYKNLAKDLSLFSPQDLETYPIDAIVHAVNSELSAKRLFGKRSLIIFDNAPSDFISKQLHGQLPTNCDILVTSKDLNWPHGIDLSDPGLQLTQQEGIELLKKWIENARWDLVEAERIVERLHNLPTVLAQAGNFMQLSKTLPLKEYLPLFEKNKLEVLNRGSLSNLTGGEDIDIVTSLKMSIEKIEKTDPEAVKLLQYCALLPAKKIPTKLLLKLTQADELTLQDRLRLLSSLISCEKEKITIHDLFQEIIVEGFSPDKEKLLTELAEKDKEFYRFFMLDPRKAIVIYEQGLKNAQKDPLKSGLSENKLKLAFFSLRLGEAYKILGNYKESLWYNKEALSIHEAALGEMHIKTASSYHRIGRSLIRLGQYEEALTYTKKGLKIRKKTLGTTHLNIAISYDGVGKAFSKLGRYEEGLEYTQKALKIREKTLGEIHISTAISYGNVGRSFSKLGRYESAFEYAKKEFEITKKILGETHPNTATSYNNVGMTLLDLRRYEEGLEHIKKGLKIRKKTLGEIHPSTAKSYNNIGMALLDLEHYEEGLEHIKKGLEIRKKTFSEQHPYVASSYNNVGIGLLKLQRPEEGLDYVQKGLEIREKTLGTTHPQTAESYKNKGAALLKLERPKEAFESYRKSYFILIETLPKFHPEKVQILMNIIESLKEYRDLQICEKVKNEILPRVKQEFGGDHALVKALEEACKN